MQKGFLILFLLLNRSLVDAQLSQPKNQLLWEISGNGLKKKSYLFGSLHSNDKRLFRFADSVYVVMESVESIVLETDVFSLFEKWDTRKEETKQLFDNQGNPYTGSSDATKTIYGSEDGMPQFMDAYFLEYCYNTNKSFYPLEPVDDQLDLIDKWGQIEIGNLEVETTNFTQEKMMEFYLKGDIQSLDRMMRANLSPFDGMYKDLILERNKLMLKGIDSLVRKKSLLCVVGAGHLYGEEGLIELLRRKGYKMRKIEAVFSEEPIAQKLKVKASRNYTYHDEVSGVTAIFPGKPMSLKIWDNHPYLIYRELGQGNTYSIEIVPADKELSLLQQAEIYIASPNGSQYRRLVLDDGTEIYEGISDTYPEGLSWVRVMQNDTHLLVMKAYGGNKFMNSNRPNQFFSKVWIE